MYLGLEYLALMVYQVDLCSMILLVQGRPVPVKVIKQTTPSSDKGVLSITVIRPGSENCFSVV